jgi:hypothetical protein
MSTTGPEVVAEVWRILQDTGPRRVVAEDTIRRATIESVAEVASLVGLGTTWVATAFTTSLSLRDYTLSNASEYQQVLDLKYASDNQPLLQLSREDILIGRSGAGHSVGRQYGYALTQAVDGTVNVEFEGYPNLVEAVSALVSVVPVTWPVGSAAAPTIPFSTKASRGLELLTAAALFPAMGEDKRTSLDLPPEAGQSWRARGLALVHEAALDVIRLKRAQGPQNHDWVLIWSRS